MAGGSSFSTSVSKGGGRTVADAMAEQGESVATAVSDSGEGTHKLELISFLKTLSTFEQIAIYLACSNSGSIRIK